MVGVIFYLIIIVPIQHVISFDNSDPVSISSVAIIPWILILEILINLNSVIPLDYGIIPLIIVTIYISILP